MAISESQLEIWSHQGSITNSSSTYNSVRNAIMEYTGYREGTRFEVYLQGSYKNSTNIYGNSDVDIAVELKNVFYSNLTDAQKSSFGLLLSDFSLRDFRAEVESCLIAFYGRENIESSNKVIKINSTTSRLPVDVLVCCEYRFYHAPLYIEGYYPGVIFLPKNNPNSVINYPKLHYDNGVVMHSHSFQYYKPAVRIFKNIKEKMLQHNMIQESIAPSYFIECLLSNVPYDAFGINYQNTIINCVYFLSRADLNNFMCLNKIRPLYGLSNEQWNQDATRLFLEKVVELWES